MQSIIELLFILIFTILQSQGEPLICQNGSYLSDENIFCECEIGLFYNAVEGECQDICAFFGDRLCGYYSSANCIIDENNATSFSCECPSGYYDDGTGFCIEKSCSEAGTVCLDSDNEECVSLPGEDACKCKSGFLRNEEGLCEAIDLCKKPNGYPCSQVCTSNEDSYTCSCFEGFSYIDGKCELDDGYTSCYCSNDHAHTTCRYDPDGKQLCDPLPGYYFANGDINDVQDIDECSDEYYCPANSYCYNTTGTYACYCNTGFELEFELNECVVKTCKDGQYIYDETCVDICEGVLAKNCFPGSICMTNENDIGECRCQLSCQSQVQSQSASFSIYTIKLYTPYYQIETSKDIYDVTKSMEIIFGIGNAEVIDSINVIHINVGLSQPKNIYELKRILQSFCWPLDVESFTPKCIFPNGLIVDEDSTEVLNYYPCAAESPPCNSSHYANCTEWTEDSSLMPGSYRCDCFPYFEQVTGLNTFYCTDINICAEQDEDYCPSGWVCEDNFASQDECVYPSELISSLSNTLYYDEREIDRLNSEITYLLEQLDDQERTTVVVGSVLGAILFCCVIGLSVIGFFIFKIKFR